MMTPLYSEPIPVTEIASDWFKYHFPRDSRVITCMNLTVSYYPSYHHQIEIEIEAQFPGTQIMSVCVLFLLYIMAKFLITQDCNIWYLHAQILPIDNYQRQKPSKKTL
jgi:hypothetical protein